ncbi:MAG: flagellar motor switch protein FliM [Candidatus Sericytochromatia bacterium]|nr:flagellar motor switch protein FliM [Candidatus Sericytochromatia bacterium]
MSDILSQNEIDALMAALAKGEVAADRPGDAAESDEAGVKAKAVWAYDFRRQSKFSKDHIRTLSMLHDGFARLVSTLWAGMFRVMATCEVVSVEQMTFDEYSRSLPGPTIMTTFSMKPLVGSALLEINLDLASIMIDRLLGGPGKVSRIRRDLTDIERQLITNISNRTLSALQESWVSLVQFDPVIENIETNPRFVQLVPATDPVALVTLEVKLGENTGPVSICLPYMVLEKVMTNLGSQYMFSTQKLAQTDEFRLRLNERVVQTQVPLTAVLGSTVLSVQDVLQLQRGDVVALEQGHDRDIEVRVGDRTKFMARPGTCRSHMAVHITEVVLEEGETHD